MSRSDGPKHSSRPEGRLSERGEQSDGSQPSSSGADAASRSGDDALPEAEWKHKQSRRIYHLRAQTGLTQEEFAALMGWSTSKQSQIEQNTDSVRIRPMDVMAARFVATHPLQALRLSRGLPARAREKIKSYAERLDDFDMP